MQKPQNTLLSLGHGYCAAHLAAQLLPLGWRVIGTSRSAEKLAMIAQTGVEPLLWPADLGPVLQGVSHVLHSASPIGREDPFLAAAPALRAANLQWMGYLSTTGVYGDTGGAWVDETSPTAPARGRSSDRVWAEAAWLQQGLPLQIFRLSGIYGPGRGPFEKLRNGTAQRIIKPGQVFSRIHVDDIAAALRASIARPDPGRIYNLCDDLPSPADAVLDHAASLLGLPPPPAVDFANAELSPMARSFYAECRRVRNDRVKQELGLSLMYPSYREGLAAILAQEQAPAV